MNRVKTVSLCHWVARGVVVSPLPAMLVLAAAQGEGSVVLRVSSVWASESLLKAAALRYHGRAAIPDFGRTMARITTVGTITAGIVAIAVVTSYERYMQAAPATAVRTASSLEHIVAGLCRSLKRPIVAFQPANGTPSGALVAVEPQLVCQRIGLVRLDWRDKTCLAWDVARSALQVADESVGTRPPPPTSWHMLLYSLTDEQMRTFERGQALATDKLTSSQQSLVRDTAERDRSLREAWPDLQSAGQILCYVQPDVALFRRGRLFTGETPVRTSQAAWTPAQSLRQTNWRVLEAPAERLVRAGARISIFTTTTYALGDLPRLIPISDTNRLVISEQVRERRFVVSPGLWDGRQLLIMIQMATCTEIRTVGDVLIMAPSNLSLMALRDKDKIRSLERDWQHFVAYVRRLKDSPLNKSSPLAADTLISPRLVLFRDLSSVLRDWTNTETPDPVPSELDSSAEIECCFLPHIVFEFSHTAKKVRLSRGIGPQIQYTWLAFRTLAM